MEKMDQHVISTRPGLSYTGRPHARVLLAESSTTYTGRPHARVYLTTLNMGVSHERVHVEPKFSPTRKRPLLKGF
ncbi:hypothetical protein F383_26692 [Gossypium arboreum]|uniref:Uncharacterized protein n=1 Tax=Gossypium arboreum TaxID=29729 RepID=A0A0B0P2Q1_GOSAR|nr:hypothetical protein F383_26692 [Gossypium arboreum]